LTLQRGQEEMRMAKEVAERANQAKDSFLATLSHELRTPLTPALMSLLALEREEELSDFVRAELIMIRRNIELETRLIDDLLDLTRIANGKLELHSSTIDLHAVLMRAVEICRPAMDAKQQRFMLQLNAQRTATAGDAIRLQHSARAVVARADDHAVRTSRHFFFARVIHPLEEILDHPGERAEIFGRGDQQPIAAQKVLDPRFAGALQHGVHFIDRAGAFAGGRCHLLRCAELRVIDDQQRAPIRRWCTALRDHRSIRRR